MESSSGNLVGQYAIGHHLSSIAFSPVCMFTLALYEVRGLSLNLRNPMDIRLIVCFGLIEMEQFSLKKLPEADS